LSKCYVRNGVWAWPVERQQKALGDAWDRSAAFEDVLRADVAKAPGRVRPEALVERAEMLRPSGRRKDEIHVATLLAIAVSEADLVSVLAAASARNAAIVAHDSGLRIEPSAGAADMAKAIADWQRAKELARTEPGRLEGVRVAAEKKRNRTMKLTKIARPLWRSTKPDRPTTSEIEAQVGLSAKTLYAELGRRPAIKRKKGSSDD